MLKAMGKLEEERAERFEKKPKRTERLPRQQENPPKGIQARTTLPNAIAKNKRTHTLRHHPPVGPPGPTSSRSAKQLSILVLSAGVNSACLSPFRCSFGVPLPNIGFRV